MRVFGLILAGGAAERMGGADKALIQLQGQTLLDRVVERLAPQVEDLALSANGPADRFARSGLPVLADSATSGSRGPLSGVLAGLAWAGELGATHLVSAAVDTPFFPFDLVPQLCMAGEAHPEGFSIVRSGGRDHPTFGLWPIALADDLRRYLLQAASTRMMGFVEQHGAARADFADARMFANLNSPQDLAAAVARIEKHP
jgi:molybdenum cofactor guanylyltransferase